MRDVLIKCSIIVPIILYLITAWLIVNSRRKLKSSQVHIGTIMRLEPRSTSVGADIGHRTVYCPIISYTVDGQTYEFVADYFSSSMKVGKDVRIRYSTEDPSKATVEARLYVVPVVVGSFAVCCTFAYIFVLILLSLL